MPEEVPAQDSAEEDGTRPTVRTAARRRRRRRTIITVTSILMVSMIVAFVLIQQQNRDRQPQPGPTTGAATPIQVTKDPQDAENIPPARSNVMGPVEGAPGLWRGTATVTRGNSSTVLGVPIGWPRTVDGAVAAGINHTASMASIQNVLPRTARQLDNRLLTKAAQSKYPSSAKDWERAKAWYHLDEAGNPLDMDDRPSPELRLYFMGYPRYAAYRVDGVGENLGSVTLSVWMPMADGVASGDDTSAVRLQWIQHTKVMRWEGGDWRCDSTESEVAPQGTKRLPNLDYPTVARLLGPGWSIPSDGTDQPYPGAVLAR